MITWLAVGALLSTAILIGTARQPSLRECARSPWSRSSPFSSRCCCGAIDLGRATGGGATPAFDRREQYPAGARALRRLGPHRDLQPALSRDVRVVVRGGEARLHHAAADRAPQGDRILRRRYRRILQRHHPQRDARQGDASVDGGARRPRHRDREQAAEVRRMGGHHRGHHRAQARRREDRPYGALRCADRPAQPRAVPRAARAGAAARSGRASSSPCSISTSTNSRASTMRSAIWSATSCSRAWPIACAAASSETDIGARLGGDEFAVLQTAIGDPSETDALVERIHAGDPAAVRMPRSSDHDRRQHRHRARAERRRRPRPAAQERRPRAVRRQGRRAAAPTASSSRAWTRAPRRAASSSSICARRSTDGEFELYYQPLVNLETARISWLRGAAALAPSASAA